MNERETAIDIVMQDIATAREAVDAVTGKILHRLKEPAFHQIVRPLVRRTLKVFRR